MSKTQKELVELLKEHFEDLDDLLRALHRVKTSISLRGNLNFSDDQEGEVDPVEVEMPAGRVKAFHQVAQELAMSENELYNAIVEHFLKELASQDLEDQVQLS